MCAPAILPIISAVGGIATVASQLGILGNNRNQNQAAPTRTQTPPPSTQAPSPMAAGAGDDEQIKPESIEVKQNAKQKRDKQTVKKGLASLGAASAVNTGVDSTPAGGVNTGT